MGLSAVLSPESAFFHPIWAATAETAESANSPVAVGIFHRMETVFSFQHRIFAPLN